MKFIDKKSIAEILVEYISNLKMEEVEALLEIPPSEIDFTYAFPCFRLAKLKKRSPDLIAKDLENKVKKTEFLANVRAIGPYLNFKIKPRYILENIFEFKDDYGRIRDIIDKEKNITHVPLNTKRYIASKIIDVSLEIFRLKNY